MMSHEPEDDEGEARKGEWKYLTLQNILWVSFLSWRWSLVKYVSLVNKVISACNSNASSTCGNFMA